MNREHKKQLIQEYLNRRPEMGVISLRCLSTGESFLGISKDFKADLNSYRAKLQGGNHPNKRLQELWNLHGAADFEFYMLQELDYDDPKEDHTHTLSKLRDGCLAQDPLACKIWR